MLHQWTRFGKSPSQIGTFALRPEYPSEALPLLPEPLRSCALLQHRLNFFLTTGERVEASVLGLQAWGRVGRAECMHLAPQVVKLMTAIRAEGEGKCGLTDVYVPAYPQGVNEAHFALPGGVYRRLIDTGLSDQLKVGRASVADLVAVPKFGAKAMLRFLGAVEVALMNVDDDRLVNWGMLAPVFNDTVRDAPDGLKPAATLGRHLAAEVVSAVASQCGDLRLAEISLKSRGWAGYPKMSLRQLGKDMGMSHESARLHLLTAEEHTELSLRRGGAAPKLRGVGYLVAQGTASGRALLVDAHPDLTSLYGQQFVASLYDAAARITLDTSFQSVSWNGQCVLLHPGDDPTAVESVSLEARRSVYRDGIGRFSRVVESLNRLTGEAWPSELVTIALRTLPGFVWLDPAEVGARRRKADVGTSVVAQTTTVGEWFWIDLVAHSDLTRRVFHAVAVDEAGTLSPEVLKKIYGQFAIVESTSASAAATEAKTRAVALPRRRRASDALFPPYEVFEAAMFKARDKRPDLAGDGHIILAAPLRDGRGVDSSKAPTQRNRKSVMLTT